MNPHMLSESSFFAQARIRPSNQVYQQKSYIIYMRAKVTCAFTLQILKLRSVTLRSTDISPNLSLRSLTIEVRGIDGNQLPKMHIDPGTICHLVIDFREILIVVDFMPKNARNYGHTISVPPPTSPFNLGPRFATSRSDDCEEYHTDYMHEHYLHDEGNISFMSRAMCYMINGITCIS